MKKGCSRLKTHVYHHRGSRSRNVAQRGSHWPRSAPNPKLNRNERNVIQNVFCSQRPTIQAPAACHYCRVPLLCFMMYLPTFLLSRLGELLCAHTNHPTISHTGSHHSPSMTVFMIFLVLMYDWTLPWPLESCTQALSSCEKCVFFTVCVCVGGTLFLFSLSSLRQQLVHSWLLSGWLNAIILITKYFEITPQF